MQAIEHLQTKVGNMETIFIVFMVYVILHCNKKKYYIVI